MGVYRAMNQPVDVQTPAGILSQGTGLRSQRLLCQTRWSAVVTRGFGPVPFMIPLRFLVEDCMHDVSKLKLLCSCFCKVYQSEAKFYVEDRHPWGIRHLVVVYDKGGHDGRKEFITGIPKEWTENDVESLILWPTKDPEEPYPAWEIPARAFGKAQLFRWWADEKSDDDTAA